MAGSGSRIPEGMQKALNETRDQLLAIHKVLLDHERARYEKAYGPIGSAMTLLQLVIDDPSFQWLKPLSALITQIDECSAPRSQEDALQARSLLVESQRLLSPNEAGSPFQQAYLRAIQESPDIGYLHGEWKKKSREI